MSNRKKLYIPFAGAIPDTIGAANRRVFAFPLTQATIGTAAADQFGNFLAAVGPLTAGSNVEDHAKRRVTAVFQPGFTGEAAAIVTVPDGGRVSLDFIGATVANITAAASIDPNLTRHFRVRAWVSRLISTTALPRVSVNGTIYVQQQHSLEA